MELNQLGLADLRRGLDAKEFSALEIFDCFAEAIGQDQVREKPLNAFCELWLDGARDEAKLADQKISRGETAPLLGIPLAIKDNLACRGRLLEMGSRINQGYRASYTAHALEALLKAGAILIGRTNLDEFAMGSSGETSVFGPTLNPHDRARTPGGSSSGSAVAVAAGLVPLALGSDAGGSIRQPAALSGVVGLKPGFGRVSRHGLVSFAPSFDQLGPLTRRVEDAAYALNILAGQDSRDPLSLKTPPADYREGLAGDLEGLRIGIPREYLGSELEPEVKLAFEKGLKTIEALGGELIELSLPLTELAGPAFQVLASAEASSSLGRFDGVHYGRAAVAEDLVELYEKTRGEGFGLEVKKRLIFGTWVLSGSNYQEIYLKAQAVREAIRLEYQEAFNGLDLLVSPTSLVTAPLLGEIPSNPDLADFCTRPANLAGLPALSLPLKTEGLPIGLQLIADQLKEDLLLKAAWRIESSLG